MPPIRPVYTTDDAITLAEAGWRIWPVRPGTKAPANCTRHVDPDTGEITWTWNGPLTPDAVAAWWHQHPFHSIQGFVPDGLVVIDIDPRNQPTITINDLPTTLTVNTGGGGWHLYYRRPNIDLLTKHPDHPGVDVLAGGTSNGKVILPPSVHESGNYYTWADKTIAPVALPTWLSTLYTKPPPPERPTYVGESGDGVGLLRLFEEHLEQVAAAQPGCRRNTLNGAAFVAGRIVGAGLLDVDEARARLFAAAPYGTGFDEKRVGDTIERGLSDGARNPFNS